MQFSFPLSEMQYDKPQHLQIPWSLCLPWKLVVPFKIWLFPQDLDADSVLSPRERHILDIIKVSSTRIQNDCQYNKDLVRKCDLTIELKCGIGVLLISQMVTLN